jgi:hypothetical protein
MASRTSPQIEFNDHDSSITITAEKDRKTTICAKWKEWCGESVDESSRSISVNDLFEFLVKRDKYINECARELCGKEIAELRKMYEIKVKELREANFKIIQLEDKVKAYRTIMKEMRAK